MFKFVILTALLAVAAAKPSVVPQFAYSAPIAYSSPVAYSAPVATAYSAPVASAYSAPVAAYSTLAHAAYEPYSAYSPYAYSPYAYSPYYADYRYGAPSASYYYKK